MAVERGSRFEQLFKNPLSRTSVEEQTIRSFETTWRNAGVHPVDIALKTKVLRKRLSSAPRREAAEIAQKAELIKGNVQS